MRALVKRIQYGLSLALPDNYFINYALALPYFVAGNSRFPRNPKTSRATINDYIFERMLHNDWTPLHRQCVDKELVKAVAGQVKGLKCPRTVAIFPLSDDTTVDEVKAWMAPYAGQRLVMKPAHSSGGIVFLDKPITDVELAAVLAHSKKSCFRIARETQYIGLERKLILEENIAEHGVPNDYKFFCIYGKALYCQIDIGRFGDHKRAICKLPDLEIQPVRSLHDIPDSVDRPANLEAMIAIAEEVSAAFDFVRVDLYNVEGEIFFGECVLQETRGRKRNDLPIACKAA